MKPIIIIEDWKEPENVIEQLLKGIESLGGYVYNLPSHVGSDTYGLIISDKKLSKKKINKIDEQISE